MRWRNPNSSASIDEENPYWMSFSDMMASLLVIFMLATAALMLQLSELIDKQEKRNVEADELVRKVMQAGKIRQDIVQELKKDLESSLKDIHGEKVDISVSLDNTVVHIPEAALRFTSGSSEIPDNMQENVRKIGNVLYNALNKTDEDTKKRRYEFLDTVFIEGHTDSNFYNNAMLRGNWGLSAMRAISVWQFWEHSADQPSNGLVRIFNHDNKSLFSVSGYGDTRPINKECEKYDDKCHEKNRRIDIRITERTLTQKELESLLINGNTK